MSKKAYIIVSSVIAVLVMAVLFSQYLIYSQEQLSKRYYTIAVLPDTQNYSEKYPDIFKSQTKWIADNIKKEKIAFAVNEGDIVNDFGSEKQWQNAKSALDIIKGKLPLGILMGNHDMAPGRESPLFKEYFPFYDNKGYKWEGEDYPAGTGYNSYQLFSMGKEKFISIDMSICPTSDVLSWADGILKKYSARKAIIATHGFLDTNANRNVGTSKGKEGGCTAEKNNTQYIWDKIVYPNANVFLVLCGHMHGEAMRVDSNIAGKPVYQLLADYQDRSDGGAGYMRLLEFRPLEGSVRVKTYSPYLDRYEMDKSSDFILYYGL